MNISILCSDVNHPIYPFLVEWGRKNKINHNISVASSKTELDEGEILFLISCDEIINNDVRKNYKKTLVIHASDLPNGRGWSPHIWQILEGGSTIVVSLLEADDQVDSGEIWCKKHFFLEGNELAEEINKKLFTVELELMDFAVSNIDVVVPIKQDDINAKYYRKRCPSDSKLDPNKNIADQFELLRVSDANRFPAFIDYRGCRYSLKIEKIDKSVDG